MDQSGRGMMINADSGLLPYWPEVSTKHAHDGPWHFSDFH